MSDDAEAAVVHDPVVDVEEVVASFGLDFRYQFLAQITGDVGQHRAGKHREPVAKTALAVFKRSGAVEESSIGDFEMVAFEELGVFGNAWVIPGMGRRVGEPQIFPSATKCGD